MTDEEKQEIIEALKAEATDIRALPTASSLQGILSLPAIGGSQLVNVPLSLLVSYMADLDISACQTFDAVADTATIKAQSTTATDGTVVYVKDAVKFAYLSGGTYYGDWPTAALYMDDERTLPLKNKIYICDGSAWVWNGTEQALTQIGSTGDTLTKLQETCDSLQEQIDAIDIATNALTTFDKTYISEDQVAEDGEGDLFKVIQDRIDAGYTYIDLRSLNTGKTYTVEGYGRQVYDTDGNALVDWRGEAVRAALVVDKPCEIVFNVGTIEYAGPYHMIAFACDGCKLTGHNRMGRTSDPETGSTILKMTNDGSDDYYTEDDGSYHYHAPCYHVFCRGYNNAYVQNITFRGIRSTRGCQYGSWEKKLLGCGGLYFEKPNPMQVSSGNTVNNLQIVNVAVFDTIAHCIYANTPILSNLRNVRCSGAGGYGVFVQNGTTMTLDTVFVTSANYGGFLIMGLSYLNMMNCASENNGLGYWIRSCQNVTMYSPGAEELVNLGKNMWAAAYKETGAYGLNLSTTGGLDENGGTDDRGSVMQIKDVNSDYYQRFRGTAFLITGGSDITVMTPYATTVGMPHDDGGDEFSNETFFMRIDGNCRGLYVLNPGWHFNSSVLSEWLSAGTVPLMRNEIYVSSPIAGATIYYNMDTLNCLQDLVDKFGDDYGSIGCMVTKSSADIAPVRITSGGDIELKAGNRYFTTDGVKNIYYKEAIEVAEAAAFSDIAWDTPTIEDGKATFSVTFRIETGESPLSAVSATCTSYDTSGTASEALSVTPADNGDGTYTAEFELDTTQYAYIMATLEATTRNTAGDTFTTQSDTYKLESSGKVTDDTTGEVIISGGGLVLTPAISDYDSSANKYYLTLSWQNLDGVATSAGAYYSTNNTTPTASQNTATGTIADDGGSASITIKGSSTQRYVRFFLNDNVTDTYVLKDGEMTKYTA